METFTEPKDLVENPFYYAQRQKSLVGLAHVIIDAPINDLIRAMNRLPHCFTLQSCYGHFLYKGQDDPGSIDSLPMTDSITTVEYRIAYIAFCIENSTSGRKLFEDIERITGLDPRNIQFGSAEWFWRRQVNSYALQVEPERFRHEDKAILDYSEALGIERLRNEFFTLLNTLLQVTPGNGVKRD